MTREWTCQICGKLVATSEGEPPSGWFRIATLRRLDDLPPHSPTPLGTYCGVTCLTRAVLGGHGIRGADQREWLATLQPTATAVR